MQQDSGSTGQQGRQCSAPVQGVGDAGAGDTGKNQVQEGEEYRPVDPLVLSPQQVVHGVGERPGHPVTDVFNHLEAQPHEDTQGQHVPQEALAAGKKRSEKQHTQPLEDFLGPGTRGRQGWRMSTPTSPLLEQFLTDVTAHKKALWDMKVALWRTLYTNAGISESTARNYYAEVEAAASAPAVAPDFQVVDLNALPEGLREQVRTHLEN